MAASPAPLPLSLPDQQQLDIDEIASCAGTISISVSTAAPSASCPACGTRSVHVHSRYYRLLRDLPCQGSAVRIHLRTRRYYCRTQHCDRRVFTERFPTIARAYGRQTIRFRDALAAVGYALGGEAGCRLAAQLGFPISADTILRIISECSTDDSGNVRVLGVDDWAWRRGHRYGTVLVDLERHQPIDLLPDREAGTLAKWLVAHPTVRVISRDRAGAYADAARQGAPDALQIADRFHLFCNLTQAIHRLLERLGTTLQNLQVPEPMDVQRTADQCESADMVWAGTDPTANSATFHTENPGDTPTPNRQAALFQAVKSAYERGLTKSAIARECSIDRRTVRKYLHMNESPRRAPRRRRSALDPFREYLRQRWTEGCHNASQLCRELRTRGYRGQRSRLKEYVQSWRTKPDPAVATRRRTMPNLRLVALWIAKAPERRSQDEQNWVQAAVRSHPNIACAEQLAQQFRQVFKHRNTEALRQWLSTAASSGITDVIRFASGLQRDYDAVAAAVEQPWSNGQVEGQVHRLKLLKRQMYGRSGFSLLRIRVLRFRATPLRTVP
jgi:transposase